jgi:hypothetical protein
MIRAREVYNWVTINGQTWMAITELTDCEGYADTNDTVAYGKLPLYSCPDGWATFLEMVYQLFNFLEGNK